MSKSLKTPVTQKEWNVIAGDSTQNATSDATGIHVTYAKGQFASQAGINFKASPPSFPSTTVTLSYQVYFPNDFDFVKGGKLPGIWGGQPGSGGGDWNDKGWSFRVMFREKGTAVAYIYMSTDQGQYTGDAKCKLVKNQGPGFDTIAHHTNGAGIDLWRDQGLVFKRGQWNDVVLRAKCNSPGTSDGLVSLTVNNVTKTFPHMRWSEKLQKIEGIAFATWFGGGSKKYAPTKTQKADFRNVSYVL